MNIIFGISTSNKVRIKKNNAKIARNGSETCGMASGVVDGNFPYWVRVLTLQIGPLKMFKLNYQKTCFCPVWDCDGPTEKIHAFINMFSTNWPLHQNFQCAFGTNG